MSSLVNGATPTSIDTQLPTSTTFHNTSSISNKPSSILPLSSISTNPSSPVQDPLTSSEVALDVAPNTTQSSPTQPPSTTASDSITKETAGNFPSPSTSAGRSLTAEDDTPKTTSPAPTSDGSQIIPSTSPTSTTPTSSLIPTQIPSSATEAIAQPSTATTVSSAAVLTATPSTPILSSISTSSQSENQTPTLQPSSPRVSPTPGIQIGKDASSVTPARPSSPSSSSSQATSAAARPTGNFVQGPQILSAAAVAPPSSQSSTFTSTSITSSAVSIQGGSITPTQGRSQVTPSQPTNPVVSTPEDAGTPNKQSPSPASIPLPVSSAISLSIPSAASTSAASDSAPISTPNVAVGNSILSETPSNTNVPITSPTPNSTGGVGAFPTAINSLPGDLRASGLPGSTQPTGQPIADPVGSSSNPSTATIVGGTVGGIAAAAFIVVLLWLWRRKVAGGRAHRSIEKDSFKPMTQKFGISTTLGAAGQNLGKKFASRNVNMDRGNSQFLESVTVEPTSPMPPQNGAQNPATDRSKPKARKLGLSFDHGKLFNPFSDANALMSGSVPPHSSILSNPFADDNMVLPPPVSASTRRSRGRSLGGIRSFQAPTVPPRAHSVHRESLQSNDSFLQRRDKFRSDPFDLELESRLVSPENGVPSRSSSVYSNQLRIQQNNRDSYTSRYVSGSSLGDWTDPGPDAGSERVAGRRDSPTLS